MCVCVFFASCCGTLIKSKLVWIELSLTGNPQHTCLIMTSLVKALNAPLYWARAFHIPLKEIVWMVYVTLLSLSEMQLASLFHFAATRIGCAGKTVMTAFQMLLFFGLSCISNSLCIWDCKFEDVSFTDLQALSKSWNQHWPVW